MSISTDSISVMVHTWWSCRPQDCHLGHLPALLKLIAWLAPLSLRHFSLSSSIIDELREKCLIGDEFDNLLNTSQLNSKAIFCLNLYISQSSFILQEHFNLISF